MSISGEIKRDRVKQIIEVTQHIDVNTGVLLSMLIASITAELSPECFTRGVHVFRISLSLATLSSLDPLFSCSTVYDCYEVRT